MNLSARIITESGEHPDSHELYPAIQLYGEMRVDTRNLDLMLRDAPTLDSTVITAMPKGSRFFCYGMTDKTKKWLLGSFTTPEGKIVAGFAHIDYLTKIAK